MWEYRRHDWVNLQAGSRNGAGSIPAAIEGLRSAASASEADDSYWRIDNVVVVQGRLYESAVASATCLVMALQACTSYARPRILELLFQLAWPLRSDRESDLARRSMAEVIKGLPIYLSILENDADRVVRARCLDTLCACPYGDASLVHRIKFYLNEFRAHASDQEKADIEDWLDLWTKDGIST